MRHVIWIQRTAPPCRPSPKCQQVAVFGLGEMSVCQSVAIDGGALIKRDQMN